ncbi:hypothetical protein IT779_34890 [Nocardia sp. NEAU-351]|uniref:Uncharacterized protein n=1 Tax=Nocardia bovistercoris TaxID=2785916 RepID=A0A931IJJ5_9NOCA|nr:hypothetical protein [Nocardia bovistercoris]MBH0781470.1 hypothetical protein [Nocardia bovistercoris]
MVESAGSRIKNAADDENEIHDVTDFRDAGRNVVTPVAVFPPEVALVVVSTFAGIVRAARSVAATTVPDADGIVRSQTFEEGEVYLIEKPFDGFFADRYLMDFYDVTERGICSRMHLHTGLRFVRMMTGPDTRIRVSSLSPFEVTHVAGVTPFRPHQFTDDLPGTAPGVHRLRHNLIVPPCSFVDMQIPRGVSHQFNAMGEHAVIDSVHPEESIEVFRERMSGYRMTAQTVFLADDLPDAATCADIPG